jgi:UDP-glucose 4-epimerase
MIGIWGANGFIGRHLTHHLSLSGKPTALFARDFKDIPFPVNAKSIVADFMQPETYSSYIKDCSVLVLAVSASAARTFMGSPEKEIELNVSPYKNLFNHLRRVNVIPNKIIYLSSGGAIYGDAPPFPISESFPINPITPYGIAKAEIEKSLKEFCNEVDCDYTILRIANPVGRWFKKPSLVSVALNCAKSGTVLNVQGDGSYIRDYFDVCELVVAISVVAEGNSTRNTILNVGSGVGHSINDIVNIVQNVTNEKITVNYIPEPAYNIPYNVLDCAQIRHYTKWTAKKPIDKIIDEMWKSK